MAEFKISKLRYTWKGDWTTSTDYVKDDVVRYEGSVWVCIRKHTANIFLNDQQFYANPSDTEYSPAWIKMADGYGYKGDWGDSILYEPGDIVKYSGVLYIAAATFTSGANFTDDFPNWIIYAEGIKYRGDWRQSRRYYPNDVVVHRGNVLKCRIEHTSGEVVDRGNVDDEDDSTYELWMPYSEGFNFYGEWRPSYEAGQSDVKFYRIDDLVVVNGSLYRCIKELPAGVVFTAGDGWVVEQGGSKLVTEKTVVDFASNSFSSVEVPEAVWDPEVDYVVGDIVRNGGWLFQALRESFGKVPLDSVYGSDVHEDYWGILAKGDRFVGDWDTLGTTWKTGDVVRRGGELYVALVDSTDDESSLSHLDLSNWERIATGQKWTGSWADLKQFSVNDVVIFRGSVYRCTIDHISNQDDETKDINIPRPDGVNPEWELLIEIYKLAGMTKRGDLLSWGLLYELEGDLSSYGPVPVEIGGKDPGEVLVIGRGLHDEEKPDWTRWGECPRVVYVAADGVDDETDPLRGVSP